MPRNGSGVYSSPPGTHGITDNTILSTPYNTNVDDVAQDLNTPRPIVAGGTGATTPAQAFTNLAAGGGTMGGNLTIATSSNPFLIIDNKSASNSGIAGILARHNGVDRWHIYMGDADAEAGSNTGSTFAIERYSDAGGLLGQPLTIKRDTGLVTIGSGLLNVSAASGPSTLSVNGKTVGRLLINGDGAGVPAVFQGQNRSQDRWYMFMGDGTTESGGNAGSNFSLQRVSDAGAVLGTSLAINRATGAWTVSGAITTDAGLTAATGNITGGLSVGGALSVNGTATLQALTVNTTASITGNATVGGTLQVAGGFTPTGGIPGGLSVGGALSVNGTATLQTLVVNTTAGITGNTTIGGTLGVTGNATMSGTLSVTGLAMAHDVYSNRGDGTGIYYFGGGTTKYLWLDGSNNFNLQGGTLFNCAAQLAVSDLASINGANSTLTLNNTSTGAPTINGSRSGSLRWVMNLGKDAESSGNAGSNFYLRRFSDAGAEISAPLEIIRSSGNAIFSGQVTVGGGTAAPLVLGSIENSPGMFNYSTGIFFHTNGSGAGAGGFYFQDVTGASNLFYATPSQFIINNQGYKPGGGPWADSSDGRIKTVIDDYGRGLDEILRLRPVWYTFKGNDTPTPPSSDAAGLQPDGGIKVAPPYANSPHCQVAQDGTEFAGLIAQEVNPIFPSMVSHQAGYIDGEQTNILTLDTTELIFALVNAVKELNARISALEATAK